MLAFLALGLIGYLGLLGGLYAFQRNMLFVPDRTRPVLGQVAALGVREVILQTADGLSLLSWYLPPRDLQPVIAYFHGNGGNLAYRSARLARFAQEGYGVLMPEYRGYGGNPGSPSERGFYADAGAALDFLAQAAIAPDRIVLYGESLGTAVAVFLAARHRVAAVILESPFTSIAAVAQKRFPYVPAAWLIRDPFDALASIRQVTSPILVMQGGRDRRVAPRFGRALFAAASEPKEIWVAPQAGHAHLARFGALDVVVAFIKRRVGCGGPRM